MLAAASILVLDATAQATVRGLRKAEWAAYAVAEDGSFQCRDGSATKATTSARHWVPRGGVRALDFLAFAWRIKTLPRLQSLASEPESKALRLPIHTFMQSMSRSPKCPNPAPRCRRPQASAAGLPNHICL